MKNLIVKFYFILLAYEPYRNFRYAKEDLGFVFRSGLISITILNSKSYTRIQDFENFFPQDKVPMYICANETLTRIYGYSLGKRDTSLIILSINVKKRELKKKELIVPLKEKWVGLELNTKGNLLVTASCIRNSHTKLLAIDTSDNTLVVRGSLDLREPEHKISQFLRKIKGYDYYVLACGKGICIFGLIGTRFLIFKNIKDIYLTWIVEVLILKNHFLPIPIKNEKLKLIEFNKKSYNSLVKKELNSSALSPSKSELIHSVYQGVEAKKIDIPKLSNFVN